MFYLLARGLPKSSGEWMMIGAIAVAAIGIWAFLSARDRARRRRIGEQLTSLGFTHTAEGLSPDAPEIDFFHANPLLKYERNTVRWLAAGELAGRYIRVLEYRYTTGHGKSTSTHDCTIAATDLPIRSGWIVAERKRWFTMHAPSQKARPLPESVGDLRRTFHAFYDEERAVSAILTPRVCELLNQWTKKNWLHYRDGMLMLGVSGAAKAEHVRLQLDALVEIADAIEKNEPPQKQTSPLGSGLG
jgi:hypothetical protein